MRIFLCVIPLSVLVLFFSLLLVPLSNVQADEQATFDSETGVLFLPEVVVDGDSIFEDTMLRIDFEFETFRLIQTRESNRRVEVDCGPQFSPPIPRPECNEF